MQQQSRAKKRKSTRRSPRREPGALETAVSSPPAIRYMGYGPDGFEETSDRGLGDWKPNTRWPVTWIDVDGPPHTALLEQLQQSVGIHPLALEDVVHQGQRPKVERYLDHHFIVVHMISHDGSLVSEQLSLFLSDTCVLTFQGEVPSDSLEPVRDRIRAGRGRVRTRGTDYLAYALLDSVVEAYFPVCDMLGDRLSKLEAAVLAAYSPDAIGQIQALKRDLLQFRRLLWPLSEALASLSRSKDPLITEETRLFLRDCRDHVSQIKDLLEVYQDTAETLVETYLSVLSNRTNDTMRFLTLIATIFIPLTFVVGVYGMNFDTSSPWNMPELRWRYGYPAVMGVMLLIAIGFYRFFLHRRW